MATITQSDTIKDTNDVFSCKIIATQKAYVDIENSAFFWQGENSSYCLWGDNLTISGTADSDFVSFLAPNTVLCSGENAEKLVLKKIQHGQVMKKHINGDKAELLPYYLENANEVFSLLNSCEMADNYENFLMDTSLKLRRGLGAISLVSYENKLVSTALCSYVSEQSAIILAVATDKNYRKMGFAKQAVLQLEQKLLGRTIFLLKEDGENDEFYEKLGYQKCDNWVLGTV